MKSFKVKLQTFKNLTDKYEVRFLYAIFIFFTNAILYAQVETRIEFHSENQTKTLHCLSREVHSGHHYFCKDGNDIIFVNKEDDHVSGLLSSGGNFKRVQITQILSESVSYAKSPDSESHFQSDLQKTYNDLLDLGHELNSSSNYPLDEKNETINLKNKFLQEINHFKNKLQHDFNNHENLKLTTTQGHEINCNRGTPRPSCLLYQCAPIKINGELYEVQFNNMELITSLKSPHIILVNDKELGPSMGISEIKLNDKTFFSSSTPRSSPLAGISFNGGSYGDFDSRLPLPFNGKVDELDGKEAVYQKLDDSYQKTMRAYDVRQCEDPRIQKTEKLIQNQYEKLRDQLAQKQLVELVRFSDNQLTRELILATDVSAQMCHLGADVWTDTKSDEQKIRDILKGHISKAKSVSKETLNKIFEFAINQEDIPWKHYQDGCYARAHVLSDRLKKEMDIETEKIWAFGQLSPDIDPKVKWSYHVATKINVVENGKQEIYVIDPSIAPRPLKEHEWLEKINPNKVRVTKTSWPAPIDTGLIRQVAVSYSPSEIYFYKDDKINEEKILRNLKSAMKDNERYQGILDAN